METACSGSLQYSSPQWLKLPKPMLRPCLSCAQAEIRSLVMTEFWWTQGPSSNGQFKALSGPYWTMKDSDGLFLFWLQFLKSPQFWQAEKAVHAWGKGQARAPGKVGRSVGTGGREVNSKKRFQSEKWSCKRVLEGDNKHILLLSYHGVVRPVCLCS